MAGQSEVSFEQDVTIKAKCCFETHYDYDDYDCNSWSPMQSNEI